MGSLNCTPDSFSDGGRHLEPEAAITGGLEMLGHGAERLLEPLARGRERALRKSFAGAGAEDAMAQALEAWLQHKREHGPFRGASAIGSSRADRATYLGVEFGKTSTTWRATWTDDRRAFTEGRGADRALQGPHPSVQVVLRPDQHHNGLPGFASAFGNESIRCGFEWVRRAGPYLCHA